MNQLKSLLWKEWLEIRTFFLIALFVFVGLPLLGGIEARFQTGYFEILASVWTYFLGGVLAIFVGVGTVVRDLNGRLEDFWRSRPVSVSRWLIVKYFVGLFVVIFTLCVPLVLELLINHTSTNMYTAPQLVLAWHPFLWAVLYSVGFLMACLVRRGAHAAMLSLAVMLLLYFLPEIIPPLRHLGVSWAVQESQFPRRDSNMRVMPGYHAVPWALGKVLFHPAQLEFAGGMALLCIIAVIASLYVIRRDARIESGRRTIYWSIGGAMLIVFYSASVQLASNLTLVQTIDLPYQNEQAEVVRVVGDRGMFITNRWIPTDSEHGRWANSAYPFKITPAGLQMESPIALPDRFFTYQMQLSPKRPDIIYSPDYEWVHPDPKDPTVYFTYPKLIVSTLNGSKAEVHESVFKEYSGRDWGGPTVYQSGDRLYLIGGPHLLTFDLSDPVNPRLISHRTIPYSPYLWDRNMSVDAELMTIQLPEIPELSPEQRLEARLLNSPDFNGHDICRVSDEHVEVYHLDTLTPTTVRFRKTGAYDAPPVQKMFNSRKRDSFVRDGLLYVTYAGQVGMGIRLTVFDIRDPQRPHPIAHFALPRAGLEARPYPLPDGRIVLACRGNVYVVSAPSRGGPTIAFPNDTPRPQRGAPHSRLGPR